MLNPEESLLVEEEKRSPEILELNVPRSTSQKPSLRNSIEDLEVAKHNTLSKKEAKAFGGVLGERVTNMSDDDIKKDFIKLIDDCQLTDQVLLNKLYEGINNAVYEGPKGAMLTDRKTITQIVKLVFQLKGKLKDNSQIQIINAFGNTGIVL